MIFGFFYYSPNYKKSLSNSVMATRLVLVQKSLGSSPGWTTSARVGIGRQVTLRWWCFYSVWVRVPSCARN